MLIETRDDTEEIIVPPADAYIDINMVVPGKDVPLPLFDDEGIKELAESIKQHGMLFPIMVIAKGEKYEIVTGINRWFAGKMAGLKEVPVVFAHYDNESAIVELVQ